MKQTATYETKLFKDFIKYDFGIADFAKSRGMSVKDCQAAIERGADVAKILSQKDVLLDALKRLEAAAENRDNTAGDPCRLIEVKAELAAAAAQARTAIFLVGGK